MMMVLTTTAQPAGDSHGLVPVLAVAAIVLAVAAMLLYGLAKRALAEAELILSRVQRSVQQFEVAGEEPPPTDRHLANLYQARDYFGSIQNAQIQAAGEPHVRLAMFTLLLNMALAYLTAPDSRIPEELLEQHLEIMEELGSEFAQARYGRAT